MPQAASLSATESSQTNSLRYGFFLPAPLSNLFSNRLCRLTLVAIGVGVCLWTIRSAGTFAVSRLLVNFAFATRSLEAAEKANQLTPKDPQSHFAEAAVLSSLNRPAESVVELERAVALRPADYSLWLQLGLLRDQLGNTVAAFAAFNEAVRLAPFYSQPRWLRGNLLLRVGQYDSAFKDLNQAAQSDPELIPGLIDLAWNLSKADPNLTEQWAQIKTDQRRIAFAKFLAHHSRPKDSIAQLRFVAGVPEDVRHDLVQELIANGAFAEAFEIWKVAQNDLARNDGSTPEIYDGGFEAPLTFDAGGFGWHVPRVLKGVTISLDSSRPHSGSKNLRIDFLGDSNPGSELVSQLILVEPSRRYQINFASRSENVVTGGLPLVVVKDAKGDRKRLGQSGPMDQGTHNWRIFTFDFTAGATTTAVFVSVQRENCSTSPCPIFGSISLDSFSVAKLN